MKEKQAAAVLAAFIIFTALSVSLPRAVRALGDEAMDQTQEVEPMNMGLDASAGFEALPADQFSQDGLSDSQDLGKDSLGNVPSAPLQAQSRVQTRVGAGASAAAVSQRGFYGRTLPAFVQAATMGNAKTVKQPGVFISNGNGSASAAAGEAAHVLSGQAPAGGKTVISVLEGIAHPISAAGENGSEGPTSAAGNEFDGNHSGGRIIIPGEPEANGPVTDEEELADLRQQVIEQVQTLVSMMRGAYSMATTRGQDGENPVQQSERQQMQQMQMMQATMLQRQVRDITDTFNKIEAAGMPVPVEIVALREFNTYLQLNPNSPDAEKTKTYVSWLISVPWSAKTTDRNDLAEAKKILDRDHYGLDGPKRRVMELLAVKKRPNTKGSNILLFVGPPGTGKTSLGAAIAETMGRKFARFSLGGVTDESSVRGHGRTYIGSQPGFIIRLLKQLKVKNPVVLLDEIEKMPSESPIGAAAQSAFLEVLDPEQNNAFLDRYLEVPVDLSDALFIVTANDKSKIPAPLLDRMEVIEFSGYTLEEKLEILKSYTLPKVARKVGIVPGSIKMSQAVMKYLVERYTNEPGMRNLERQVSQLLRGMVTDEEESGKPMPTQITKSVVRQYLPHEVYISRADAQNGVGRASGLYVAGSEGGVLNIDVANPSAQTPGQGKLNLRVVMKDTFQDSANNAYAYIKANAKSLGINPDEFHNSDIEISVIPEREIDGPSAGAAMVTTIVSQLTGRAVRPGIAMTGTIRLKGDVGVIGGLKEKVMGAYREGYNTVIYPAENEPDVKDIPAKIRKHMTLVPVTNIKQVLDLALEPKTAETNAATVVPESQSAAPTEKTSQRGGLLSVIANALRNAGY